jgi:hypothetical protein
MEGQSQKPTSRSSEGRLTTVANAISSAIDTDAVADSIFASLLKDGRSTKESGTKNSTKGEQASPTIEVVMAEQACVQKNLQGCLLEHGRTTGEPSTGKSFGVIAVRRGWVLDVALQIHSDTAAAFGKREDLEVRGVVNMYIRSKGEEGLQSKWS